MIIPGLERFDSPVVLINQLYKGEDWGVVASYVSEQDLEEVEGEANLARVGWHVSVTFPDFEDMDLDPVFSMLDAALEYGINQILSGILIPAVPTTGEMEAKVYSFGVMKELPDQGCLFTSTAR